MTRYNRTIVDKHFEKLYDKNPANFIVGVKGTVKSSFFFERDGSYE